MTEHEFIYSSDEPGLRLHLRRRGEGPPVLFVHGATFASPLYDIAAPGASWLEAMARAGFSAYALDVRGYGRSRSARMKTAATPYARATEAIRDIDDAVGWIASRHPGAPLALAGGSWGSVTTALWASTLGAGRIAKLVLQAPIFAAQNEGWIDLLADPDDRTRLNPRLGVYRLVSEAETRARWDAELPEGAGWRSEAAFAALMTASFADDPASGESEPPAFRAPNGTLADLWSCFTGTPVYDPAAILAPTLLIRGGADRTSTRADALGLMDQLGAPERRYVEIAEAGHFLAAERRAPQLFAAVSSFLAETI